MKKFIALSALIASIGFGGLTAEAKSSNSNAISSEANAVGAQIRVQIRNRNRYRRVRTVTRTRIVRSGFRTYRETIQTRYLPNGRVTTRVISRIRVR